MTKLEIINSGSKHSIKIYGMLSESHQVAIIDLIQVHGHRMSFTFDSLVDTAMAVEEDSGKKFLILMVEEK